MKRYPNIKYVALTQTMPERYLAGALASSSRQSLDRPGVSGPYLISDYWLKTTREAQFHQQRLSHPADNLLIPGFAAAATPTRKPPKITEKHHRSVIQAQKWSPRPSAHGCISAAFQPSQCDKPAAPGRLARPARIAQRRAIRQPITALSPLCAIECRRQRSERTPLLVRNRPRFLGQRL